ncbi:MAG: hypothetical protein ABI693_27990 [Bryobacteraceae bacterium]
MPNTTLSQRERREACLRGLRFIHRHSLEEENFENWAGDYLWCFYCVSRTAGDSELAELARGIGEEYARRWMASEVAPPKLADAGEVAYYVSLLHVASALGADNPQLRRRLKQRMPRFPAREYLGFDPLTEPPPATPARSRYDVWCDALVLTYTGEGFGAPLGAAYADVLRWRPEMLPYRGAEGGANPEFRDVVLAITHLVYTLNDYGRYLLSPEWLPEEFEFLRSNMNVPLQAGDAELLGEFIDSLRCLGVTEGDADLSRGMEFLLSSQNPDGSWGAMNEPDAHIRYHTTWTAMDALREYKWVERTEWPEAVRRPVTKPAAG